MVLFKYITIRFGLVCCWTLKGVVCVEHMFSSGAGPVQLAVEMV